MDYNLSILVVYRSINAALHYIIPIVIFLKCILNYDIFPNILASSFFSLSFSFVFHTVPMSFF